MKATRTLLAATAVAAAAAVLPATGSAAGSVTYADPTGDGRGAPDIQRVAVSNDDTGRITFRIAVDALPDGSDVRIHLFLDTDRNDTTGDPDALGADYWIAHDEVDDTFWVVRWEAGTWVDTPSASVEMYSDAAGVSVSVDRKELGNASRFDFWARSRLGTSETETYEDAPDSGVWTYDLNVAPPPPPPPPPPPTLKRILVPALSLLPRSARVFTFRVDGLQLGTGSVVKPDSLFCSARISGFRIRGRGKGGCTWSLVPTTKGRRLVVTVEAGYRGTTARWRFPLRVA
jgi:hypothetical protein